MSQPLRASNPAERLASLSQPVIRARFVDSSREQALQSLGITTIGDLLYHAPFRYLDLTKTAPLGRVTVGDVTVVGRVHDVVVKRPKPRLNVTEVTLVDDTGTLIGVWFNQPWVERSFRIGDLVAFSGTAKVFGGLKQMSGPFVEKLPSGADASFAARILPVHHSTEKLSPGWMRRLIAAAVDDFAAVPDYLPIDLMRKRKLMALSLALRAIHFPRSMNEAEVARRRLAYSELFDFQLLMARKRYRETVESQGFAHTVEGPLRAKIQAVMGLVPTAEQQRALEEVSADMASEHPMSRMLLGDVGTGKTLVAAFALCSAIDSNKQGCMMAPTEVLAKQYAAKLGPIFDELGVSWALLTGSTPASQRARIVEGLGNGKISLCFGTHALLEGDVVFYDASLIIIDEQHRFGVNQRLTLRQKAAHPDVLVMSATPIPRTLALVAYGDLSTSYLRTRPVLGAGVTTHLVKHHQAHKGHDDVRRAVKNGQQAYIVCALVDESDALSAKSAMREAENLANLVYPDMRLEVLHGRMRPAQKEEIMQRFVAGEIDILVSTTVIEVGVDVSNATVMIILDAERFGLAQLHQLRGRVGRGSVPGNVWLVSDSFSDEAKERFGALLETDDGFKLSELDLKQRGAGELLGRRQSGYMEFKIASLVEDGELVDEARRDAFEIVAQDPYFNKGEHAMLALRIEEIEARMQEWVSGG